MLMYVSRTIAIVAQYASTRVGKPGTAPDVRSPRGGEWPSCSKMETSHSPNDPMIRRGEGGRRGVGRAFMVARGAGCGYISPKWEPGEQDAGDHKGPPSPTQPRSPLQILMGLFFG